MAKPAATQLPAADPAPRSRLLTPCVIVVLLAAAVAVWLAVTAAAAKHRHDLQHAASAALAKLDKEITPETYLGAFTPTGVPLGRSGPPVYLYVSPTTSRYLASAGGDYQALLAPWRDFFTQRKLTYIETSRLAAIPLSSAGVLILPSSVALSDAERQQLIAFQRQGGNILATWSPGARSEDGAWNGYTLLQELFGVTVSGELDRASDERFLNLFGDSPLTGGYPAGQRIWLEGTAEHALRLTGGKPAARYMDWIRNAEAGAANAAVLFDEHGADRHHARWVVLGFAESSWGAQADKLAGLLENALHWLARGAAVTKATWPVPYRAAYVIEMDTEEGFGNAQRFAGMMDAIGARATFYCLTAEAVRFPYLVRDLAKRHEIAYHGDIHTGFRGQSEALQSERLDRMQADMKSIIGNIDRAVGFRAPLEQYDRTTERLLHAKGMMHHAADPNRTDARLPFFSEAGSSVPDQALVVLPRTQHDDISLRTGELSAGAEQKLLRALVGDLDTAIQMGALGLLSIHSQYFTKDSLLHAVMPAFLEQVARHRRQVWTAAANEVADWWRERERLDYRVSGTSDNFRLDVTIDGTRPLGKGTLVVTHRGADAAVRIQPVRADGPLPALQRLDAFRTAIVFDGMFPGSYSYLVTPAPPPSAAAAPDPSSAPRLTGKRT